MIPTLDSKMRIRTLDATGLVGNLIFAAIGFGKVYHLVTIALVRVESADAKMTLLR